MAFSLFNQRSCFVDQDGVFPTCCICTLEMPGVGLASSLSTGPECPGAGLFSHRLPPPQAAAHLPRYQSVAMTDQNTTYLGNRLYSL